MPSRSKSFEFPADLVQLQRAQDAAWRELRSVYGGLPSTVETLPAGVGAWPEGAGGRVDGLLEEVRRLGEGIGAHPWWAGVPREDLVEARSALKHA